MINQRQFTPFRSQGAYSGKSTAETYNELDNTNSGGNGILLGTIAIIAIVYFVFFR